MIKQENYQNPANVIEPRLQLVAWEITRRCNLFCAHCRASAIDSPYHNELSTEESRSLIDEILKTGKPILILTGGEPLLRTDIFEIASYASGKGLRVVMGSNGTLITDEVAARLKEIPISRVAVSLDFPTAVLQDKFRGQTGAFNSALAGIKSARQAGLEIQINCTLTQLNLTYLDKLLELAIEVGAVAFHPFLLVPTGRGKGLESVELSPQQYEDALNYIYDKQIELGNRLFFKPTDAPHYLRIINQRQKLAHSNPESSAQAASSVHRHPTNAITRGCLAGIGFCFISHQGRVQGCGYLDVEAGNVKKQPFSQIWSSSQLFRNLRNIQNLQGKCGVCEYKRICGGCRARAFEATGNYLAAEPYCVHQPVPQERSSLNASN